MCYVNAWNYTIIPQIYLSFICSIKIMYIYMHLLSYKHFSGAVLGKEFCNSSQRVELQSRNKTLNGFRSQLLHIWNEGDTWGLWLCSKGLPDHPKVTCFSLMHRSSLSIFCRYLAQDSYMCIGGKKKNSKNHHLPLLWDDRIWVLCLRALTMIV